MLRIVRHRGIPSASEASRRSPGTRRSTSSVVRATIGRPIIPRAKAPASPENPPMLITMSAYPNSPTTMLGTPASTSAVNRTRLPIRAPEYSDRKMPAPMPTGIAPKHPTPTMMTEPAMA